MPFRDKARGSYIIDRRLGPIGRLKIASGTNDRKRFRSYNEMLTALKEMGRFDVLQAIKEHRVHISEVYGAWRLGDLSAIIPRASGGGHPFFQRVLAGPETVTLEEIRSESFARQGPLVGIYFLFRQGELVYIGQSKDIQARLLTHRKDPNKDWDEFAFYQVKARDLLRAEALLIRRFRPRHNTMIPKESER